MSNDERDFVMNLLDTQIQALEEQAEKIVKDMYAMYQPLEDKQNKEYMGLAKQWVAIKQRKMKLARIKSDLNRYYDVILRTPIVIKL